LRDRAEVLLRRVDRELLPRLGRLTILVLAGHDLRLADGELEALAAHVLNEDRELKLTATLHLPRVRATDVVHADRHVTDELAVQTLLDHASGELVALDLAGQRRGVGADRHRDAGLVDL